MKARNFTILLAFLVACIAGFSLPVIIAGGADRDLHEDIVLQPRHTPTSTSTARVLTVEAFARLFFTPTDTSQPTETYTAASVGGFIPITGPSSTPIRTATTSKTATPSSTAAGGEPTNTRHAGPGLPGLPGATSTNEPTRTHTAVPTRTPAPTHTRTPVPPPTATPEPPTDTTEPPPTNHPPTDPPPTDPPPTDPPPTDPPPTVPPVP